MIRPLRTFNAGRDSAFAGRLIARALPLLASLALHAESARAEPSADEKSEARSVLRPAILTEGVNVGGWVFRPIIDVRIRGEYVRHPIDMGGAIYDSYAPLAEGYKTTFPPGSGSLGAVSDRYFVAERSRLGLSVDHGPVTAVVLLQDARALGSNKPAFTGPGQPDLPAFAPFEAYLDLHTKTRSVWFRAGRQRVTWGDGRLIGENDVSLTGRSLDAARFGFSVRDFDAELMAAILSMPGKLPSTPGDKSEPEIGTGAQLFGARLAYHVLPILRFEANVIGRIVRAPSPSWLTPSNVLVAGGRIWGDYRGVRYAVEGAGEIGQVASYGVNRKLTAYAFAARVAWETALPGHLTFGAEAAYASGDRGDSEGTIRRFDPILPNDRTSGDPMGLVAWSNVITGGGWIGITPVDKMGALTSGDRTELSFRAGYHYLALAEPNGRWTTGSLIPVGSSLDNASHALGHEVDARVRFAPFQAIAFDASYGAMIMGDGGRAILIEAGRPAKLQHMATLQVTVRTQ